ncbi:MAG TPA: AMP-binding protein, partial [Bacillota bacterium]|nr:AMP-binding protein [Bacillota bacterium]
YPGLHRVPKGVAACHRSVIDYTESFCEALGLSEDCVFGNQTPLHFDAPLKEIMTTIKYGATTYLIPKKLFLFPVPLVEYLNEHKINTICWVVSALCTISALGALDIARPRYLKKIAFGSEVFPVKQFNIWRDALPDAEFYNLYGPTECTGMSCWYKVEGRVPEGGTIPIGRPFRNTRIMLIDENGKEAAPGEPGEIYIAGTSVTLGYYNNPGKTDEAFVQNPLNRSYREIVYKTGDIARLNERGELVFISRRDSQIKHMGHRIELGEIEAAADSHERVARSCCLYDSENNKIVMYYTGEAGQGELLAYLKDYLPRYMLPAVIKKLDSLPLTPNGKLDRQALKKLYKDSENEGTHKNLK